MTGLRLRLGVLGGTAVLLLAGCGGDAASTLRSDVAALTAAANDGDADAVRDAADALVATVEDQLGRDELTAERAERLTALAASVREGADTIDADLLERQQAEADAEAAREELEAERARAEQAEAALEEQERAAAEQAAAEQAEADRAAAEKAAADEAARKEAERQAEQDAKDEGKGGGKDGGDEGD